MRIFRGLTRWLRRRITGKVCNKGWVSKSLQVDKDQIYHLEPCLIGLDEKWGHQKARNTSGSIWPPPRYSRPEKKPGIDRVNFFNLCVFPSFWSHKDLIIWTPWSIVLAQVNFQSDEFFWNLGTQRVYHSEYRRSGTILIFMFSLDFLRKFMDDFLI